MTLSERLGITYCMACGGRLRADYTHVEKPKERVFLTDREWLYGSSVAEVHPIAGTDALWAGSPYQAAE